MNLRFENCISHGKICEDFCMNCQYMLCSECSGHNQCKKVLIYKLIKDARELLSKNQESEFNDYFFLEKQIIQAQNNLDIAQNKVEERFDIIRQKLNKIFGIKKLQLQTQKQIQVLLSLNEITIQKDFIIQINKAVQSFQKNNQEVYDFFPLQEKIDQFIKNLSEIQFSAQNQRIFDHDDKITSIAISKDKSMIATASQDKYVYIKHESSLDSYESVYNTSFNICQVQFLNEDQILIAGESYLELFDINLDVSSQKIGCGFQINGFELFDNNLVVACNSTTILYNINLDDKKRFRELCKINAQGGENIAIKKDGAKNFFIFQKNPCVIIEMEIANTRLLHKRQQANLGQYFANTSQGSILEVSKHYVIIAQAKFDILLLDKQTLNPAQVLVSENEVPLSIKISQSQKYLFSSYDSGHLKIWDLETNGMISCQRYSKQSLGAINYTDKKIYIASQEPCIIVKNMI